MEKAGRDSFWGKFKWDPKTLEGKEVCVEGTVGQYGGKPQIEVTAGSQFTMC